MRSNTTASVPNAGPGRPMLGQDIPPPPVPQPAVRHSRPRTTGSTVTVACKLPGGLLLRCFQQYKEEEPQRDGRTKTVKVWRPIPTMQFAVRGTWVGSAGQAFAKGNPAVAELLPGGYCLTHGVPKDIWDMWYSQNKDTPIVQKRVIFAVASSYSDAVGEAQKGRAVRSGLEPVDPAEPFRKMPGGQNRAERGLRVEVLEENDGMTSPR